MTTRFFVYGTLQPGHSAYDTFCRDRPHTIQMAIVAGRLYHLPLGYPAITLGGNCWVHGHILEFDDPAILAVLDEYEAHDLDEMTQCYPELFPSNVDHDHQLENLRYRRQKTLALSSDKRDLGQVWIYAMQPRQVQHLRGQLIKRGKWSTRESGGIDDDD